MNANPVVELTVVGPVIIAAPLTVTSIDDVAYAPVESVTFTVNTWCIAAAEVSTETIPPEEIET